jgi:cystathionine gamma-synthase
MEKSQDKYKGIMTKCVHLGMEENNSSGSIAPPITMSSSFFHDQVGGYRYRRLGNPLATMAENIISKLEKVKYTLSVSSGTAAAMLIFHLLSPGEHLIASYDVYSGILKSFNNLHTIEGNVSIIDLDNDKELLGAFKPNTKVC